LLDQKVGLTARNHATYPKLQSNIRLKLSVLESIKKQNKYLGGLNLDILQVEGNMKKKIFFNQVFKSTLSKKNIYATEEVTQPQLDVKNYKFAILPQPLPN